MQYSAINIQGNIISGEILEKIRTEDIKYQGQADFGLDKNTTIRDEIGIAWAATRAHWSAFKLRRDRLKDSDTGTSETRQGWMIPFLRELGYDLEKSTSEIINGKTYAISHRAANRDGFPVHIAGIQQSLDKRAEVGGTRLSPHALIQEYLNNHDHLYAMVTNGRFLRLLRDATRLSRLSYLEFDLERIMEEDQFAEFALLYRLLHVTRMPDNHDSGEESVIEYYHQEALSSGSRIREKLSQAVEQSLKLLANGLLKHPANQELRELTSTGKLKPEQYYLHLLRLVYRILFLMVIEERHLIYPEKRDEETNKKRSIYYQFYSINRLTRLAEKLIYVDPRKTDLWKSLLVTFKLFENSYYGEKLGLKPLGSGLFASDALGSLASQNLDNGTLLKVLQLLVTFENENQQRVRVNYADLDVEEFGSVYEGLLEYDPDIKPIDGQPSFSFVKGEGRSSSGSHYTPEELVKPLIKHSLDYIIKDRVDSGQWLVVSVAESGKYNSISKDSSLTTNYKIAPYETFKKLSGLNSLAEINALGENDIYFYKILSERRDVWINFANKAGISKHSGEHSRGAGKEYDRRISAVPGDSERFFSGIGDFNTSLRELGLSDNSTIRRFVENMRRDRETVEWTNELIKEQKKSLTAHYSPTSAHWQIITSLQPVESALLSITVCDYAGANGRERLCAICISPQVIF